MQQFMESSSDAKQQQVRSCETFCKCMLPACGQTQFQETQSNNSSAAQAKAFAPVLKVHIRNTAWCRRHLQRQPTKQSARSIHG